MKTRNENQAEERQPLQLRWYCLSANGMATLALDEDDAKNVALESDQLYPRNGPHQAVQMVPVQPDGRGTDAQILKERDIARCAIVGALAAGYAGQDHPGAEHWLAAAHDAGVRIAELEKHARPQAVPMTEEQIVAALKACDREDPSKEGWIWRTRIKWARAVEAHHGITAPAGGEGQA